MLSNYNNDPSVYIALAVCIFFLYRLKQSLKGKVFSGITYTQRMLSYGIGVLIFSGFIYWYYRKAFFIQPGIESWLTAFDVTLAHIMVTITLILITYFLFQPVVEGILKALSFLFVPLMLNTKEGSFLQIVFVMFFRDIPPIGTWLLISFLSIKIFLVNTMDMQNILFGSYDASLGFSLPTTYRFSILSSAVQTNYSHFATNEILASLIAFFIVASASVMGITGIIKTMGELEHTIFSKRVQQFRYKTSPINSSDKDEYGDTQTPKSK